MNKLTVVTKNETTYFIKRLTEEVKDVLLVNPYEKTPVEPRGAVLVRTTGVHGSGEDLAYVENSCRNSLVINPSEALRVFRTKKSQYEFFGRTGVPHLPWLYLADTDVSVVMGFLQNFEVSRYLIKPHRGQGGWGIRLLHSQEVLDWFQSAADREYVLQPYIIGAREHRFFFIQEDWHWTLERYKGEAQVAANFQLEGKARSVDPDLRFLSIVKEIRSRVPLFYGAMDVLLLGGELFVLEMNSVPGIEQLEAASSVNVIRKLLTSINSLG